MRAWTKKFVELKAEEMTKQTVNSVRVLNLDRTNKGAVELESLKVYPVTLVNLLGVYGDFERDSNGNGLADGWTLLNGTPSLVTGVVGSYAQQNEYDNTAGTSTVYMIIQRTIQQPITSFFVSGYVRKTTNDTSINNIRIICKLLDADGNWVDSLYVYGSGTTTWEHVYGKKVSTAAVNRANILVDIPLEAGAFGSYQVDGLAVYDLEAMGALPPPLQTLYGVTNWADLDADTLATLLPYCGGVCSIGFAWETDV